MGRLRSEKNRNAEAGFRNRSQGLRKKSHQLRRLHGCSVLLVIQRDDGSIHGYQSSRGLVDKFTAVSGLDEQLWNPENMESSPCSPVPSLSSSRSSASESELSMFPLSSDPPSSVAPASGTPEPRAPSPSEQFVSASSAAPPQVWQPKPVSVTQKRALAMLLDTCFG